MTMKEKENQVPDFVREAEEQMAKGDQTMKREEVTIKFGKGLAEPFRSRDGREFMRILIPNQDPADKKPWASFVLPAKAVHDNQYGKGLWAKIPADGTTILTQPERITDGTGKTVWNDEKRELPNTELKALVEAYKTKAPREETRKSVRETIDEMMQKNGGRLVPAKPEHERKRKGPEL